MITNSAEPMRMRALKAVAVVLALLLMVPGVEALVHVAGRTAAYGSEQAGLDSRSLVDTGDPFEALNRIEDVAFAESADMPDDLNREVGLLPGASEVRVDAANAVVGYVVSGDVSDAAARLTEHMGERGWGAVSLGGVDGATFVKSEGVYVWALAACTQTGDETSVVVRCVRA